MPRFKDAIEGRDLALFPKSVCDRMVRFVSSSPPMELRECQAVKQNILDEVKSGAKRGVTESDVSHFLWPQDDGPPDSDEEDDEMRD